MKSIKFLILCTIFAFTIYGNNKIISKTLKTDSIVFEYLDSIKRYLDSLGVKEPVYVMSQAAYESGWFNCKNCSWSYNNVFGFVALSGGYLRFKTLKECIIYYANWQKSRYSKYKLHNPKGTYLDFLKWCHYASGASYNKHVQQTYDWIVKNWQK